MMKIKLMAVYIRKVKSMIKRVYFNFLNLFNRLNNNNRLIYGL